MPEESGRHHGVRRLVGTSWTWLERLVGPEAGGPVSVRVDVPSTGEAVGGVVIIPAIGRERVVSYRSLRAFALRAAQRGFVAVSVDVSGEGDTPLPVEDGALADAWHADVATAVAFARSRSVGPVHVIGLRLGAALVGAVPAERDEVRLLWEPIAGCAWIRQMRTLRRFTLAQPTVADGMELYDLHLRTGDAHSLRRLDVPEHTDRAAALLVRRERDRGVADRLTTSSPHQAQIPHAVLEEVLDALPAGIRRPVASWVPEPTALTAAGVRETHLLVGGRHAVLTEPVDLPVSIAFAYTAIGAELATGPGGIWAWGARRVAVRGAAGLRIDRSQLGDAVDPRQVTEPLPYTDRAVVDTCEQLDELRGRYPGVPVVGVGACAGAWCFLRAASARLLARVVAVNHIHWAPNESHYNRAFYVRAHGDERRLNLRAGPMLAVGADRDADVVTRVKRRTEALLHRLGGEHPRLAVLMHRTDYGDRVRRMLRAVPDGVAVDLLLGDREYGQFIGKGGRRYLGPEGLRLPLRVRVSAGLDHSLSSEGARREVLAHLDSLIR